METIRIAYEIPVEPAVDVLVIGGGSSGIAAATAAARGGAKTVLVERYGFLGGTSTAGMVGPFMTSYSADGTEQVIAGIFQEMVDRMVALGGAIDPGETEAGDAHAGFIEYGHAHVTPFHVEALKLAALEMTAEAGVRHRFHTWFVDALTTDDRRPTTDDRPPTGEPVAALSGGGRSSEVGRHIAGAVVLDKGGLRALPARIVIDTSADGDVSVRAGAEYAVGRPDGKMMPATMFFRVGNIDDARLAAWSGIL